LATFHAKQPVAAQPALKQPGNNCVVAKALSVKPVQRLVECRSEDGVDFSVRYDKLVIATGSQVRSCGDPYSHYRNEIYFFLAPLKICLCAMTKLVIATCS